MADEHRCDDRTRNFVGYPWRGPGSGSRGHPCHDVHQNLSELKKDGLDDCEVKEIDPRTNFKNDFI